MCICQYAFTSVWLSTITSGGSALGFANWGWRVLLSATNPVTRVKNHPFLTGADLERPIDISAACAISCGCHYRGYSPSFPFRGRSRSTIQIGSSSSSTTVFAHSATSRRADAVMPFHLSTRQSPRSLRRIERGGSGRARRGGCHHRWRGDRRRRDRSPAILRPSPAHEQALLHRF
jgi:hypothetical protein